MKLYVNDKFVKEDTVVAIREVLSTKPGVLAWFNSSVKSWNSFHKRVELRDQNDNLWGLEL